MDSRVVNFGCRLNAYEAEVIKDHLIASGSDDVIVINSCTVTKEAERQVVQSIRHIKKLNPDKQIVVTGCAAQVNPAKFAQMKEVSFVVGNEEKTKLNTYIDLKNKKSNLLPLIEEERILVNDIASVKETALHMLHNFEGRSRAFLQIQNGCNHRCTFCIIPFGRGNSRSVPFGDIVEQAKKLVDTGFKEIVLTGVDIGDYGRDLAATPTLSEMVSRLLKLVPDLKRLRLSSIDVAEIDEQMIDVIKNEERFMPYLHISLQAGDNLILKRMKRRHNREQVVEFCSKIRTIRKDIAFGADLIAGFPTETEEMFDNTYNLIKETGLVYLHVFPYSERDGTPAARMPQVEKKVRKERAKKLIELGKKQLNDFLHSLVGSTQEIIIENNNCGRSANFSQVRIEGNLPAEVGSIANVLITGVDDETNELLAFFPE